MHLSEASLPLPSSLATAASEYAAQGLAVFPVAKRGKRPITRHGVKDATTDLDQVQAWWRQHPNANIGLAIPQGLLVVDLDSDEALGRLRAEDLTLPTTAMATTGRGRHLWYRSGDAPVKNAVGIYPDVDLRAPGGYVVAPPSVHPTGAVYRWIVPLRRESVSECPEWLLERLANGSSRSVGPGARSPRDWLERLRSPVPEGRRNHSLAQVAGLLFRNLPAGFAAELAFCWAKVRLQPALPDEEVSRTINSIAGCELRRRGEAR